MIAFYYLNKSSCSSGRVSTSFHLSSAYHKGQSLYFTAVFVTGYWDFWGGYIYRRHTSLVSIALFCNLVNTRASRDHFPIISWRASQTPLTTSASQRHNGHLLRQSMGGGHAVQKQQWGIVRILPRSWHYIREASGRTERVKYTLTCRSWYTNLLG